MNFFKTVFDYQTFIDTLLATVWDVLPIAAVLFIFQLFVIRKPIPHPRRLIVGFLLVLVGLAFFLEGLEMALFPVGKLMAQQLTNPVFLYGSIENIPESLHWRDFLWVYLFGAAIGFACTIAEPALIAVSLKAEEVSGGAIRSRGLRIAVAMGAATDGHSAGYPPNCHWHTVALLHHRGLHRRDRANHVCSTQDLRASLRLGWCDHVDGDRTGGGRSGARVGDHYSGSQRTVGRLRPYRLDRTVSDCNCTRLRADR